MIASALTSRLRPLFGRRAITLSLLAVMIGTLLITAAATFAQPAAAFDMNPCESDQTLPVIEGSGKRGVSNERKYVDGYAYITYAGADGKGYPDGLGMTYKAFGMSSCGDAAQVVSTGTADGIWQFLAVLPMRALGGILDWVVGGRLAETILGFAEPIVTTLGTNVWGQLAPFFIMIGMLGLMLKMARGKGREGWTGVGWMLIVITAVGIFTTAPGLKLATTANTYVSQIARTAMLAPMGANASSGSVSDAVMQTMLSRTWAQGVMGDLGNEAIPTTLQMTKRGDVPAIHSDRAVTVPIAAIPAAVAGQPTWAETWRWTSAYTTAESSRIGSDAGTRCSISEKSPETVDISNPGNTDLSKDQLCTYKWLMRTAILSELVENYPEAYQDARGATNSSFNAAGMAALLIPASVMLAMLGIAAILAEVEFVLWFIASPIIGLLALRDVQIGRRWAGNIAGSFIRRVLTAFILGLGVMLLGLVQNIVYASAAPNAAKPWLVGLLGVVLMVAARKLYQQVLDLAEQSTGMSVNGTMSDENVKNKTSSVVKGVGLAGVGAIAGAASAGQGNLLAGAMRGGTQSMRRGRGLGGTIARGTAAGASVRHEGDVRNAMAERSEADAPTNEEQRTEAEQEVADAFKDLAHTSPEFEKELTELVEQATDRFKEIQEALESANQNLANFDGGAQGRIESRMGGLMRQGHGEEEARRLAIEQEGPERRTYTDTVRALSAESRSAEAGIRMAHLGEGSVYADRIETMFENDSPDRMIAQTLGLDEAAVSRYRVARAEEARLAYWDE